MRVKDHVFKYVNEIDPKKVNTADLTLEFLQILVENMPYSVNVLYIILSWKGPETENLIEKLQLRDIFDTRVPLLEDILLLSAQIPSCDVMSKMITSSLPLLYLKTDYNDIKEHIIRLVKFKSNRITISIRGGCKSITEFANNILILYKDKKEWLLEMPVTKLHIIKDGHPRYAYHYKQTKILS